MVKMTSEIPPVPPTTPPTIGPTGVDLEVGGLAAVVPAGIFGDDMVVVAEKCVADSEAMMADSEPERGSTSESVLHNGQLGPRRLDCSGSCRKRKDIRVDGVVKKK